LHFSQPVETQIQKNNTHFKKRKCTEQAMMNANAKAHAENLCHKSGRINIQIGKEMILNNRISISFGGIGIDSRLTTVAQFASLSHNPLQLSCVAECLVDQLQRRYFLARCRVFCLLEKYKTILYLPLSMLLHSSKQMMRISSFSFFGGGRLRNVK
jgi:hypothetical protein